MSLLSYNFSLKNILQYQGTLLFFINSTEKFGLKQIMFGSVLFQNMLGYKLKDIVYRFSYFNQVINFVFPQFVCK